MTFADLVATGAWAPVQSVLLRADSVLARAAEQNAATAVHIEAARRIGWRSEETEFLVLTDPVEAHRPRPVA